MTVIFITFFGNGYGITVSCGRGPGRELDKKLRDTSRTIYIM